MSDHATTMDYIEYRTWPLTSPTTCYSSATCSLATETHVIDITEDHLTTRALSLVSPAHRCRGYDRLDEWHVTVEMVDQDMVEEAAPTDDTSTAASSTAATAASSSLHRRSASGLSSTSDHSNSQNSTIPPSTVVSVVTLSNLETGLSYTMELSGRPLAPTLAWLTPPSSQAVLTLWLGSADDARLSAWQLVQGILTPLSLTDTAFTVPSSIMGLAVGQPSDQQCHVVVACQDGTIRLIHFTYHPDHLLSYIAATTVIVDGPLVSVVWSSNKVVVGSLLGYVCEFNNDQGRWKGPSMVAEGQDDAVLSVGVQDDMVALGTVAGRVAVYQWDANNDGYQCAWQVRLPYSIHGVRFIDHRLLVVTRRSVHWFHSNREGHYDAGRAKERLQAIWDDSQADEVPSEVPHPMDEIRVLEAVVEADNSTETQRDP